MVPVTVLLRTWNAGDDLPPLLDILARQDPVPAEILVVDSGSDDGTRERSLRSGARVVDLDRTRFSHAYSTNLGFQEARTPVVAMLSQDALPASTDWLAKLVAPLGAASCGAVFGRQIPRPGCFPLERWEVERCYPATGEPGVLYSNVNSAARRSVWERYPFDETVTIAEDRFWAQTVRQAGHDVIYAPDAAVMHSHEYTLRQLYTRCRAEAQARYDQEGVREGVGLLLKGWPKQSLSDGRKLAASGEAGQWPRAVAYRLAQFAGLYNGGRA